MLTVFCEMSGVFMSVPVTVMDCVDVALRRSLCAILHWCAMTHLGLLQHIGNEENTAQMEHAFALWPLSRLV